MTTKKFNPNPPPLTPFQDLSSQFLAPLIMTSLDSFLHAEKNSKSREFLLTSRVIHDLMVAAAAHKYDLLVYTPTVDSDGFDLILDDRDRFLPLQLKSVISDGKTSEWAIHRRLIRPGFHEGESLGFPFSPQTEGRSGGCLLIEVKANMGTVDVIYRYTDLRILMAFWLGIFEVSTPTKKRLKRLRDELFEKTSGKVNVPRTAFLKAHSPEHLLALAGLHSRYNSNWHILLFQLAKHEFTVEGLSTSSEVANIRESLKNEFAKLAG